MSARDVQDALLKQLKNPFNPKFVKWRIGATSADKSKGIALAYIDSREVMKRFDEVMGVSNWQDRLVETKDGFICEIDLWIEDRWVTRSNAAGFTKVEAVKGGASDAFKRAASVWGVGRYLYYLPNVWVPIKQVGNNYVLTEIPELPDWALPGNVENWEDVAEMKAAANSGIDDDIDLASTVIEGVDIIRATTSETELEKAIKELTPDQKLLLVNEIGAKRRELAHAAKIGTADSKRPTA